MDLVLLQTLVLVKLGGKELDVKSACLCQDARMGIAKMSHSSAFVMTLQNGLESIVTNVSETLIMHLAQKMHFSLK